MNKVYIAGKISGLEYLKTFEKFYKAEKRLSRLGFDVINPMHLVKDPEANWDIAMRVCISTMVEQCDTIFLLPDWKLSRGATLEYQIANELQFKLLSEEKVQEIENNQFTLKAI